MKENFWQTKDMKKLTSQEWDAICDKCGLCCLHKIIDDDTNELFYTNVACNLLDLETRQCSNYENRLHLNSSCIQLTASNIDDFDWLPDSCAYIYLKEHGDLPENHYLKTKSRIFGKKIPVRLIHECDVSCIEDHIIEKYE